jgi:DNA helicase-2/ATP-dependent DNA helicase PcrA
MEKGAIDFVQPGKNDRFNTRFFSISSKEEEFVFSQLKSSYERIINHDFDVGCNKVDCKWCSLVRDNIHPGDAKPAETER